MCSLLVSSCSCCNNSSSNCNYQSVACCNVFTSPQPSLYKCFLVLLPTSSKIPTMMMRGSGFPSHERQLILITKSYNKNPQLQPNISNVVNGLGFEVGLRFRAGVRIQGKGQGLRTRQKCKDFFHNLKTYLKSSPPSFRHISKASASTQQVYLKWS